MEKEEGFESYERLIDSFTGVKKNIRAHFLLNTIITVIFFAIFYQFSRPKKSADQIYMNDINTAEVCLMGVKDLISQNVNSPFLGDKILKTLTTNYLEFNHFEIKSLHAKSDFNCLVAISKGSSEKYFKLSLEFRPEVKFKKKISLVEEVEKLGI